MSHPDALPELFLDRSLGAKRVPAALRAEGYRLVTMAEHYGVPADQDVSDTDWLRLCGERGWLALMKDERIRYVEAEKRALLDHRVRAAVITNGNLSAEVMAARIIRALPDLALICADRQGPFLYAMQQNRIDEIAPD